MCVDMFLFNLESQQYVLQLQKHVIWLKICPIPYRHGSVDSAYALGTELVYKRPPCCSVYLHIENSLQIRVQWFPTPVPSFLSSVLASVKVVLWLRL